MKSFTTLSRECLMWPCGLRLDSACDWPRLGVLALICRSRPWGHGPSTDPNSRAILIAMAGFAQQTGAFVIAEGIEDDESLASSDNSISAATSLNCR